jgi:HAD superfamily hydrolase (TIGR01484 family)
MYILSSDYDGTLSLHGSVSSEDKAAIEKWRKAGNLFGIISGRGYTGICEEIRRHELTCDFLICNNGSVIYDGGLEPVEQFTVDGKILQSLVPFIIEAGGWRAAITHGNETKSVIMDNGRDQDPRADWITLNDLKNIPAFNQLDTRFEGDAEAKEFAEKVNKQFGQYVTAWQNAMNVDIVPKGVDKAAGLLRYITLKNVSKEQTLVIGDNYNDLSMILEFEGYTVTSGNPEVIAQSKKAYNSIAVLIKEHIGSRLQKVML